MVKFNMNNCISHVFTFICLSFSWCKAEETARVIPMEMFTVGSISRYCSVLELDFQQNNLKNVPILIDLGSINSIVHLIKTSPQKTREILRFFCITKNTVDIRDDINRYVDDKSIAKNIDELCFVLVYLSSNHPDEVSSFLKKQINLPEIFFNSIPFIRNPVAIKTIHDFMVIQGMNFISTDFNKRPDKSNLSYFNCCGDFAAQALIAIPDEKLDKMEMLRKIYLLGCIGSEIGSLYLIESIISESDQALKRRKIISFGSALSQSVLKQAKIKFDDKLFKEVVSILGLDGNKNNYSDDELFKVRLLSQSASSGN